MSARKRKQAEEQLEITPHTTLAYESLESWLKQNRWRQQAWDWRQVERDPKEALGLKPSSTMRIEWWNKGANYLLVYVDFDNKTPATAVVFCPMRNAAATRVIGKKPREAKLELRSWTIFYADGVEQEVNAYNATDAAAQATHGAKMIAVTAHGEL